MLKSLLPAYKMALGCVIGTGKQWMSWISLHDVIRALEFILNQPSINGPINLVAPEPVSNRTFTKTLASAVRRPAIARLPSLPAQMLLGEMADELLLSSTKVSPGLLTAHGFSFDFPSLASYCNHTFN